MNISTTTIGNVATGVLGVAILQTTLIGVGLVLIMSIAQIPAMIFTIPLIFYLFAFMDPLPAAPQSGRFHWAIGGFMAFGFIGLFLSAIILSLSI